MTDVSGPGPTGSTGEDAGFDRKVLLQKGGVLGLAGTLAAAGVGGGLAASSARGATRRRTAKKRKLIWATHFYAGVPVAAKVVVGFRDVLDRVGWSFQVIGPKTAGDVKQTLAAQAAALRLKPDVIVATMSDPTAYTASLKRIQKSSSYLLLNNAEPTGGNGLGIPFVGQSWETVGVVCATEIAGRVVELGKSSGLILIGNCCPGAAGPAQQVVQGVERGIRQFNAQHKTKFTWKEFADNSSQDVAAATAIWKTEYRKAGNKLVAGCVAGFGVAAAQAQKDLGFPPGKYPLSNTVPETQSLADMKTGYNYVMVDEQLYADGYISAAHAWEYVEAGFFPTPYYEAGSSIIKKDLLGVVTEREARLVARAKKLGLALS